MLLPLEYIKYRWNAKGRHGIHSPFVYDFVDKCVRLKLREQDRLTLNELFQKLRRDHRTVEIQDFGAGSKKMGSTRKVSDIFRMGSSRGKHGELLYRLVKHYQPERVLEFGTSLGVGTTYLSMASTNVEISTVEACENTRSIALENIENLKNVRSHLSTFSDYLNTLPKEMQFDLIFIDGHHDGEALIDYLSRLQPHAHDETLFILDDIRWSASMKSAWDSITENPDFHLTMDLFRVGIVSRRSHQEKETFAIRY